MCLREAYALSVVGSYVAGQVHIRSYIEVQVVDFEYLAGEREVILVKPSRIGSNLNIIMVYQEWGSSMSF